MLLEEKTGLFPADRRNVAVHDAPESVCDVAWVQYADGVAAPFFIPVQFSRAGGGRACVPDMGNRAGEW